jgi:hypothetical protein
MRRVTPFTLEEAKAYLIESVKEWEDTNQPEKIISLAGNAYNRRDKSKTTSLITLCNDAEKDINSINAIIRRRLKNDANADIKGLEAEMKEAEKNIMHFQYN